VKLRLALAASLVSLGCSAPAHSDATPAETATTTTDAGLVDLGAMYVTKRSCGECHDPTDSSQGLLSGNTEPLTVGTQIYAANLTPDSETGLGLWSDDEIARAMREGFSPGVVTLCPEMTRFSRMGDDEARAIIAYLRQIPAVSHTIPASVCPPIKPDNNQL
jgi:mono/diheme cytochrome c family protein